MGLETNLQSEISQKEKHKCRLLMHPRGIEKKAAAILPEKQKWRHRRREQTFGHQRGGGGGREAETDEHWLLMGNT